MSSNKKFVVHIDPDLQSLIPGYLDNRFRDSEALEKHFENKDFPAIAAIAHTLKGSGGGYGFHQLSELGRVMETAAQEKDAAGLRKCLDDLSEFLENVEIIYD